MPNPNDADGLIDQALIAAYYGCSEEAFEELFKKYFSRLVKFFGYSCWSMRCNCDEPEDFAQQVFLRIAGTKRTGRGKYDPVEGLVSTWIYGIARNLFIDHYRKAHRNVPWVQSDVDPVVLPTGQNYAAVESTIFEVIDNALKDIETVRRKIFHRRTCIGHTAKFKDIAEYKNMAIGAAHNHYAEAVDAIRHGLQGRFPQYEPVAEVEEYIFAIYWKNRCGAGWEGKDVRH